jgi:hypothetical protein
MLIEPLKAILPTVTKADGWLTEADLHDNLFQLENDPF